MRSCHCSNPFIYVAHRSGGWLIAAAAPVRVASTEFRREFSCSGSRRGRHLCLLPGISHRFVVGAAFDPLQLVNGGVEFVLFGAVTIVEALGRTLSLGRDCDPS